MRLFLQVFFLLVLGITGVSQTPVAQYNFNGNVNDGSTFANN